MLQVCSSSPAPSCTSSRVDPISSQVPRTFLLLVLTPMLIAGAYVAGAFSHGYAMNATKDPSLINVSALLVMVITTMKVSMCGLLVEERSKAHVTQGLAPAGSRKSIA